MGRTGGWNEWEGIRRQEWEWERGKGKGGTKGLSGVEKIVVTLEVHVHSELGDEDVLNLIRWVWEKCVSALGGGRCADGGWGWG
jgi:hypothetical protein